MKIIDNFKEKLYKFNKFSKKMRIILLVLCLILVIALYLFFTKKSQNDEISQTNIVSVSNGNYSEFVEQKIQSLLINLSSVKKASVFVMTNGSEISNFLFENEEVNATTQSGQNSTQKNSVVLQKNGSSNYPVKISSTYPEITGVLIYINKVDAITKNNIQKAISTVLNIDLSCIYILQEG